MSFQRKNTSGDTMNSCLLPTVSARKGCEIGNECDLKNYCEDYFSVLSESHWGKYAEESPAKPFASASEAGRHPPPISILNTIVCIDFASSLKRWYHFSKCFPLNKLSPSPLSLTHTWNRHAHPRDMFFYLIFRECTRFWNGQLDTSFSDLVD